MINSIELNNVMIFEELKLNNLAPINLFIGENNTGKSTLSKCLYMPLADAQMLQNDRIGIVKLLGKWKDKKIDLDLASNTKPALTAHTKTCNSRLRTGAGCRKEKE